MSKALSKCLHFYLTKHLILKILVAPEHSAAVSEYSSPVFCNLHKALESFFELHRQKEVAELGTSRWGRKVNLPGVSFSSLVDLPSLSTLLGSNNQLQEHVIFKVPIHSLMLHFCLL